MIWIWITWVAIILIAYEVYSLDKGGNELIRHTNDLTKRVAELEAQIRSKKEK